MKVVFHNEWWNRKPPM